MRGSRGSGLAMSLIVVGILSILSVGVYRLTRMQVRESLFRLRGAQSQAAAEAGMENAFMKLRADPTWRTGFSNKPFVDGTSFTVTLSTDAAPLVTAIGYARQLRPFGRAAMKVKAQALITRGGQTGRGGIRANTIVVNGLIDSYDSSVSTNPFVFGFGAHPWSNGTITTQTGALRIRGHAFHFLNPPPSGPTVEGLVVKTTYPAVLPFHDGSAYVSSNDNMTIDPISIYTHASKDVTVPAAMTGNFYPGVYYLQQFQVQGTLIMHTTTGTVTIYIAGPIKIPNPGHIENTSGMPSRLKIYQQVNDEVTLNAVAPLHADLECSLSTVDLTQDFYGNIVANQLNVGTVGLFHYDRQFTEVEAVTWQSLTWSVWAAGQ